MSKDGKYFASTANKGELQEIKVELNSNKEDVKKEAVKKVIAAMTVGKDVSLLFTDVLNCMQTKNLELKKLVYLYVMNYAKAQPERVVLAVNTFQMDAKDPNPLIRALAIRTMGCIRVESIAEHLCHPLQETLKDSDPYVRKTAAICVAKLYDLNPELVENQGFIETLNELLADSNQMVVANAVAALAEIDDMAEREVFRITKQNLSKLLNALQACTEWGQVFILNSLAKYIPSNSAEAEQVCERVSPRLNYANSAVVLGAIRVILLYLDVIADQAVAKGLIRKMAPPLVTLLSKEPEIQYVALRNINLIVQKRPEILASEMKVFFCKYNDPIYVKMEKLEIMIMLVTAATVDQVLMELKESATEVDVEFVRKSVRAIGRCAIKIEEAAKRCVGVLLDLINTKVNYVVQEAVVVLRDIFRRYPNQYEGIIATLCENLETLDEPEAKAAMIWIIGEYADRIDNADELLEGFLENFADEPAQVQLQMLTAVVKLFLRRPKRAQELVKVVLDQATEKSDNPDLRDRGFVYWRLLTTDPEAAKSVVLADKALISDTTSMYDASLLDELIQNLGTLSSVYHKPPDTFVSKLKGRARRAFRRKAAPEAAGDEEEGGEDDADGTDYTAAVSEGSKSAPSGGAGLLDFGDVPAASVATKTIPKQVILTPDKTGGLTVSGAFQRRNGKVFLDFEFQNAGSVPVTGFMLQLNKNIYRLAPAQVDLGVTVAPGSSASCSAELSFNGPEPDAGAQLVPNVQIAIKCSLSPQVFFANAVCPMYVVFMESGRLDKPSFLKHWKEIPEANERRHELEGCLYGDADSVSAALQAFNLFEVARKQSPAGEDLVYFSVLTQMEQKLLVELTLRPTKNHRAALKTNHLELERLFIHSLNGVLHLA